MKATPYVHRGSYAITLVCVGCGRSFERCKHCEDGHRAAGKQGPYCGKSCAARAARERQIAAGQSNLRVDVTITHGTEGMYSRGCRCNGCREAHAERARQYREREG